MNKLLDRIKEQQFKKRRGKFNKNEVLYEFIENAHVIQKYN